MTRVGLLLVCLAVSLGGPLVRADLFYLTNGGRLEGELLNPDESPRLSYELQTAEGGKLKLASGQVERVVVKSETEKKYDAFVATMPDTVDAHWETAKNCEKAGLTAQREYHLEQVLRLDPNHEKARYALGFSRVAGAWVRADEHMKAKGYVRYGGAWRLPQEVALDEAERTAEKQTVEWRKNIKKWRDWVEENRDRAVEGANQIAHIRSPQAAPALVEAILREKNRDLRLLYIEPLGEIGGNEALIAFIRLALQDADVRVRDACLERLANAGSKAAVRQFIKALKSSDNGTVLRAAVALGRMKDPEATLPLIEALITEHKQVIGGGSGISPTFSGDGGAGMSMGGGQKVVKTKVQNKPALEALNTIHLGVNYGYDQARWKAWYVSQTGPKAPVHLRRSQ